MLGRSRTCNLRLRRATLYPIELRARRVDSTRLHPPIVKALACRRAGCVDGSPPGIALGDLLAPGPVPGVAVPPLGSISAMSYLMTPSRPRKIGRPVPISTNRGQSGAAPGLLDDLEIAPRAIELDPGQLRALEPPGPGFDRPDHVRIGPIEAHQQDQDPRALRAAERDRARRSGPAEAPASSRHAGHTRPSVGRRPSPGNGGCSESPRRTPGSRRSPGLVEEAEFVESADVAEQFQELDHRVVVEGDVSVVGRTWRVKLGPATGRILGLQDVVDRLLDGGSARSSPVARYARARNRTSPGRRPVVEGPFELRPIALESLGRRVEVLGPGAEVDWCDRTLLDDFPPLVAAIPVVRNAWRASTTGKPSAGATSEPGRAAGRRQAWSIAGDGHRDYLRLWRVIVHFAV